MKPCITCGIERTPLNTYGHGKYYSSDCKTCHNKKSTIWTKANPKKVRVIRRRGKIKQKYGISTEEYHVMYIEQGKVCAICKLAHDRRPMNIDHCHKTGKVRGLLCDKCNLAIGLLNDDADLVNNLEGYLREGAVS
jgi:hypothetical protein